MKFSIRAVVLLLSIILIAEAIKFAVEDHLRLVQVRQLLKDHGTPIQMDSRK